MTFGDRLEALASGLAGREGTRTRAIAGKSRGEMTPIGPLRSGEPEGPCRRLPIDAGEEIDAALAHLPQRLLEPAASP